MNRLLSELKQLNVRPHPLAAAKTPGGHFGEHQADELKPGELQAAELRAGELTVAALLNCLLREIAHPAGLVHETDGGFVDVALPGTGTSLRADVTGVPPMWRSKGHAWREIGQEWQPMTWPALAQLIDDELTGSGTGARSGNLLAEVSNSHAFMASLLTAARAEIQPAEIQPAGIQPAGGQPARSAYLESEQSLLAGHRFHPAPKARSGSSSSALRYAPETGSSFQLRYLGVDPEMLWQAEAFAGAGDVFDAELRDRSSGIQLLPVHPWQYDILMREPVLPAALASGMLTDAGLLGPRMHPTSSVRTVTTSDHPNNRTDHPDGAGRFLKLSLSVQLTNCLRINPRHEAAAAVALTRMFEPLRGELARTFPGTELVREPAARSAVVPIDGGERLADHLGVIAREGLRARSGIQLVLAAALTEPRPAPAVDRLLTAMTRDTSTLVDFWDRYLALVIPPVLYAWFEHGVVLEAHLQNVVAGLPPEPSDLETVPGQVFLRDLEGCKLTGARYQHELAQLPAAVRDHVRYDPERGWDRVAYCLFINHITGVLAALADRSRDRPSQIERLLWSRVKHAVQSFRIQAGDAPQLRDLLLGGPLPAKTNLLTRWRGIADRQSTYVPVHLPLS